MASSIAAAFPVIDPLDDKQQSPQGGSSTESTTLSTTQEMQQMEAQGQSAADISATLGLPLAQVESDLGITTTPTPAIPTSGTISIKV